MKNAPSGRFISHFAFLGKFKRKNATKNLEIKGGVHDLQGLGDHAPPPLISRFFVALFLLNVPKKSEMTYKPPSGNECDLPAY